MPATDHKQHDRDRLSNANVECCGAAVPGLAHTPPTHIPFLSYGAPFVPRFALRCAAHVAGPAHTAHGTHN